MSPENIKQLVEAELQSARLARSNGLEGRARVCARRAAALVVRTWMSAQEIPAAPVNAMDTLETCRTMPNLPDQAAAIIDHLLMRVSADYALPVGIDLIAETDQLVELLLA